jgi:Ca2+-transporting ATPase
MSIVTLAALDLSLPGGLHDGSGDIVRARTMAFTTLVLAQLFNCFNARSDRTSAFRQLFTNRLLWAAIGVSLLLQVMVVQVPFFNEGFQTTSLTIGEWLLCTGLASIVMWAAEGKKLIQRWSRRDAASQSPAEMSTL